MRNPLVRIRVKSTKPLGPRHRKEKGEALLVATPAGRRLRCLPSVGGGRSPRVAGGREPAVEVRRHAVRSGALEAPRRPEGREHQGQGPRPETDEIVRRVCPRGRRPFRTSCIAAGVWSARSSEASCGHIEGVLLSSAKRAHGLHHVIVDSSKSRFPATKHAQQNNCRDVYAALSERAHRAVLHPSSAQFARFRCDGGPGSFGRARRAGTVDSGRSPTLSAVPGPTRPQSALRPEYPEPTRFIRIGCPLMSTHAERLRLPSSIRSGGADQHTPFSAPYAPPCRRAHVSRVRSERRPT